MFPITEFLLLGFLRGEVELKWTHKITNTYEKCNAYLLLDLSNRQQGLWGVDYFWLEVKEVCVFRKKMGENKTSLEYSSLLYFPYFGIVNCAAIGMVPRAQVLQVAPYSSRSSILCLCLGVFLPKAALLEDSRYPGFHLDLYKIPPSCWLGFSDPSLLVSLFRTLFKY